MKRGENWECCMCGDSGLSNELFRCKLCLFRSQHRYCSNVYPKAESNSICNWCLTQKDHRTPPQNPSNDKRNSPKYKINKHIHHIGDVKVKMGPKYLSPESPIKKPRPLTPPTTVSPKRVTVSTSYGSRGGGDGGNSSGGGGGGTRHVTKHVFRHKVRRYKLLEEVCN